MINTIVDAPVGGEELEPGVVLAERYRIGSRLGRGGMGVVYEGEHVTVGRPVAVKVLSAEWADNTTVTSRFRAEARAASAAGHPNIIEVIDVGALADGRPYLVTELIRGRDLFEEIDATGRFDLRRACTIGMGIARALGAAHDRGIIHRDLKPENVMITRHGQQEVVKVLDFGIASDMSRPGRRTTTLGQVLGTPATMAPEQATGAVATVAFDIYALGVIMFQMLTAREPIVGKGAGGQMKAKVDDDAPPVASLRPEIPDAFAELVDQCLARSPECRPGSAVEIAGRLEQVRRRLQTASTSAIRPTIAEPAASLPPPSSSRSPVLRSIAAGSFMLLASMLGWWLLTGRGTAELDGASPPGEVPVAAVVEGSEVGVARGSSPADGGREASTGGEESSPTHVAPSDGAVVAAVAVPAVGPVASPHREAPGLEAPDEPPPTSTSTPVRRQGAVDCVRTRKQARQAREEQDWVGMLRHTATRACWSGEGSERPRLRTKAFMELRRWDDCIESGKKLSGAEPEAWVRVCERRRERSDG